jgi:DNA-binding winged helix-turn-helix (wHTH) protein/predicted negative regulator of RcsB-dependent stress response
MADTPGETIALGDFRIDLRRRRLLSARTGEAVRLGSRAFETLAHLAGRPGILVSKAELKAAVWPDVTVEDNSVSQCIAALRRALGEGPGQNRYIATEPGRGYRFIAAEAGSPAAAHGLESANAEAFQAYVTGYSALTRPGGGNLQRGVAELERAVRLDTGFALALVYLANGYVLLGVYGVTPPREIEAKAQAAVARALALAPDFAEAHAVAGHIRMVFDLDPPAAEAAFARALALDPKSLLGRHFMGLLCTITGRFDEALHHLRLAQAQDPLALGISANIGQAHYYARRYHEAIAQLERTLELDPNFGHAQSVLGRCYLRLGDYDRALEVFGARTGRTVASDGDIPSALALSGRTAQARAGLAALIAESAGRYVSAYDLARIHMALGERDAALSALETAVAQSAQPVSFVRHEAAFDALHGEPRFEQILRRLGVA